MALLHQNSSKDYRSQAHLSGILCHNAIHTEEFHHVLRMTLFTLSAALCADCQYAMRAGTRDSNIAVMGRETVMMVLVASVTCKHLSQNVDMMNL